MERLHGVIFLSCGMVFDQYHVRGATIIPQLDARGRVYLSMVFPHYSMILTPHRLSRTFRMQILTTA